MAYERSYEAARAAFRKAARDRGARLEAHSHPRERTPSGAELTIDVALLGDPAASRVLLSISGTHGVEAPSGAAAQTAFVASQTLPDDVAAIVVHVLNPYGMAWGTHANEDNVDLSRNFIDFTEPLPFNADYDAAHAFAAVDEWPEDAGARLERGLVQLSQALGPAAALTAITGGQHHRPDGLKYGGVEPAWSRRVLEDVCARQLQQARRIAYIDFHTGLGPYGEAFFVCFHPEDSPEHARAGSWWGRIDKSDAGYAVGGTPDYRGLLWHGLKSWMAPTGAEICGSAVEFGTYGNYEVGQGMMIERWLRFGHGSPALRSQLRERLWNGFDPPDPEWQAQVTARGVELQAQAAAGLATWGTPADPAARRRPT